MSTKNHIRQAIAAKPAGSVFSSADFLSLGSRAAVDQALHRAMKGGEIVRVARGLYAPVGMSIATRSIAAAVALKTGEAVGDLPSADSSSIYVVPTSGVSRTVKTAHATMVFRRMSPRKVQLATTPKGKVLLELWLRGQKRLTTLEIQSAIGDWQLRDVETYASMIPAWLRAGIVQALAPRKSASIGLSGAYDWSNPQIKDKALITKVLEKHKFEDVARLCLHYGVPKVRRVFKQCGLKGMTNASVNRMLLNISKGLRASTEAAHE